MSDTLTIELVKEGEKLDKLVGKTVTVRIREEDLFLQFTKNGKGKRNIERVLQRGKNNEYYIAWEGTQFLVGIEYFIFIDGTKQERHGLKAYEQISQVRDKNGEWIFETQIKK